MDFTRKLPIGIQDFEKLRTMGFLYVDKTEYLYRLVNEGTVYFLGRPRRFGKSLLLSTLKAYFEGKRELFEGLVIEKLERDWVKRPVIHMDFNFGTFTDFAGFQAGLDDMLRKIEEKWGGNAGDVTPAGRFFSVISRAAEQYGQKAVVLIDEYDKPLLAHIEAGQVQEDIRAALKSFYGVLKSADPYLQFVLLTGVTKFSKVSVFSDLNQLRDISMEESYAGLCGITEEELTSAFAPELQALGERRHLTYEETLAEMRIRYNGYCFYLGAPTVYNPFSVLNTLAKKDFQYYWYQTGTPTFLVRMIRDQSLDITTFVSGELAVAPERLSDYRFSGGSPIPVLYQAGYLTIKGKNEFDEYVLGFPNGEVEYGFLFDLLNCYVSDCNDTMGFSAKRFARDLEKGDIDAFMERLGALLANIPYSAKKGAMESTFQGIVYAACLLMGEFAQVEPHSAKGRADLVVATADTVYAFEFKAVKDASESRLDEALAQIASRGYLDPWRASGKRLVSVAADYDLEKRELAGWKAA